ncbi:MAG: HD domain-containing protein, partial [Desulfitobacteriaceae bacterium]|nr:HD domain-containing protein [Desulfitobacteriaceae bacterium]
SGFEIIKEITFLKESESVKHHHERLDGSGYPGGLKGKEIPLGARIIAVADSYDAMTTDRPYRKGMHRSAALEEVKRCSGTQFDPEVVAAFVRAFPKLEGEGFRLNLALQQQKTEG